MPITFKSRQELDAGNALFMFGKSAGQGVGEVFGFDPSPDVERWRAENPLAGTVSSLSGFVIPYAGWYGVGTKIPRLAKAVEKAGEVSKSRFVQGALQEATLFAPFEAARTAIGASVGDASLQEMLKDNALSLGVGSAVGGAVKSLTNRPKAMQSIAGFVDEASPVQVQIRQLRERLAQGGDDITMNRLNYGLTQLKRMVREETPESKPIRDAFGEIKGSNQQFIQNLGDKDKTRSVNRLFKRGTPLRAGGKFVADAEWEAIAKQANLGDDFEAYVRTPRFVELPENKKAQRNIWASVKGGLQKVDDKTWISRETEQGLYVMAKKTDDGFVVFKTDSPDRFSTAPANWTNTVERLSAWTRDADAMMGQSKLLDLSMSPMRAISGTKVPEKAKNELVDAMAQTVDKYVSPRMFQLPGSGLGRAMLMGVQASFDAAEQIARRLAYGARAVDPKKGALTQVLTGNLTARGRSVLQILEEAQKAGDMPAISKILNEQLGDEQIAEMFRRGEIGAAGKEFFDFSRVAHNEIDGEILPLQRITGISKYQPLQGHHGIPRTRPGDFRVRVVNENGDTVELVGGETTAEAVAIADRVIELAKDAGRKLSRSDVFKKDEGLDTALLEEYGRFEAKGPDRAMARRLVQQSVREFASSRNFNARKNVAGYVKDWDAESLAEVWANHAQTKLRYAASLASRQALGQYTDKLAAVSGQHAFDVVMRRLEDFEGKAGGFSKAVNQITDKALGPILGKGSATKIAGAVNQFYMHLTLGAMNMAYPAINALGYLQTVLPHVAFVKNAPADLLGRYYDANIVAARNGVQGAASISPIKVMIEGSRQLVSNDEGWRKALARAANDGTMDPRFIEEYVGQHAQKFSNMREKMKSPIGWASFIKDISLLTMEAGERLSRGHAFATGYNIAKNLLFRGGSEEQIYNFAKRFTDNTMYRYATADRSTLFAGPVGSIFGLFKNWMMHYMMSTIQYAGMAAKNPTSLSAWSPLLWQIGGTSAVGGVGAWPLMALADGFSKFATDKPIQEHFYANMNESVADALYYGVPATLGLSLAAQAQMPFHAPLRDAEFMFMPVHLDRIRNLGQAIGDSVDRFDALGRFNPLDSDKLTLEWAKALAPKTVYRALQVQMDDSIRSPRSGGPLVQNIGTLDRIGYAFGMMPTEVDRMYRTSEYLWNRMEERQARVSALGQEWKEAQMRGDYRAVQDVMRRSVSFGIDPSRVVRSAQSRLRREEMDMLEYQFSPEEIWRVANMAGRQ